MPQDTPVMEGSNLTPKRYLIRSKCDMSGSANSVFVKNIIFNNRF